TTERPPSVLLPLPSTRWRPCGTSRSARRLSTTSFSSSPATASTSKPNASLNTASSWRSASDNHRHSCPGRRGARRPRQARVAAALVTRPTLVCAVRRRVRIAAPLPAPPVFVLPPAVAPLPSAGSGSPTARKPGTPAAPPPPSLLSSPFLNRTHPPPPTPPRR